MTGNSKKHEKQLITVVLGALLFALCVSAEGQQTGKVFRIGFLDGSTASGSTVLVEAFRQELSKLGWTEGKDVTIDYRFQPACGGRCGAYQRKELERLCRYITHAAIANEWQLCRTSDVSCGSAAAAGPKNLGDRSV